MIRLAISQAAFDAIARTLPFGDVNYENVVNEKGQRLIWLEPGVVARLRLLRERGESWSDVILRVAAGKLTGDGEEHMPDKWTLTFTGGTAFPDRGPSMMRQSFRISAVRDKLNDLHTSSVSAVLPDGTRLDEAALKVVVPEHQQGRVAGPRPATGRASISWPRASSLTSRRRWKVCRRRMGPNFSAACAC